MNLQNFYWYFEGGLPKEQCDELMALKQKYKMEKGTVSEDNVLRKKDRTSDIFFTSEQFIYNYINPFVDAANKNAGWNFDFDWGEAAQFTEYRKGGYYHWHQDSFNRPWNRPELPNIHGKIRKLSVTVTLSDPNEYEGGDLEFSVPVPMSGKTEFRKEEKFRTKGTVIVFPSFIWHRVTKVTKGTRDSLVIWWAGLPFR